MESSIPTFLRFLSNLSPAGSPRLLDQSLITQSLITQGPISFFLSLHLQWAIVTKTRCLIAVVDDEEPIRKALSRLIRSAGMDVETFPSGAELLESLSTRRPDCIVLDLHMPLVSGFEVQTRLAESGMTVPVIIITGHDSDETRNRALHWLPVAYLRKPVNDQNLLDAIQLALSHNLQR